MRVAPPKSAKTRVIFIGALFVGLVVVYLAATAALSDAYKVAASVVFQSSAVAAHVGKPDSFLLIGSRQRLTSGVSCAELTFLVNGDEGLGAVQVNLHRPPRSVVWSVYEVVPGWFRYGKQSCGSQLVSLSPEPTRVGEPPLSVQF